jgi:hypothetical protein
MKKWLRRPKLERCPRRSDCLSPAGHYGPCVVRDDHGTHAFIYDEELPTVENIAPADLDDPFGWNKP